MTNRVAEQKTGTQNGKHYEMCLEDFLMKSNIRLLWNKRLPQNRQLTLCPIEIENIVFSSLLSTQDPGVPDFKGPPWCRSLKVLQWHCEEWYLHGKPLMAKLLKTDSKFFTCARVHIVLSQWHNNWKDSGWKRQAGARYNPATFGLPFQCSTNWDALIWQCFTIFSTTILFFSQPVV